MGQGKPGDALVGTVLDSVYRITRVLGSGSMGLVYEAEQIRLGNRVAVKLMAKDLAADALALARFKREAEITGQLGHPHIVRVFDFGTAPAGEPFLVMEFLEGEDLEQRLRRVRRLPVPTALQIVKQTASALAATHARGIVHRDLKPANIFLQEIEGEPDFVKVLDFGVSKARAKTMKLTNATAVIGTPFYMAPEQASGQADSIDHRLDQWALAAIAYELLTGVPPFQADELTALLYRVVHEEPPLQGIRAAGLPGEVEVVIRRALSKKPENRYPTISAFARAFEKALAGSSQSRPLAEITAAPSSTIAPIARETLTMIGQRARLMRAQVADLWQKTRRDAVPRGGRLFTVAGTLVLAAIALGSFLGVHNRRKAVSEIHEATRATSPVPVPPPARFTNPPAQVVVTPASPPPQPTASPPAPSTATVAPTPAPEPPARAPVVHRAPAAERPISQPSMSPYARPPNVRPSSSALPRSSDIVAPTPRPKTPAREPPPSPAKAPPQRQLFRTL